VKQQLLEQTLSRIVKLSEEAINQPAGKQHEALVSIWAIAALALPLQKAKVVETDTQRQEMLTEHMYGQGG